MVHNSRAISKHPASLPHELFRFAADCRMAAKTVSFVCVLPLVEVLKMDGT